MQTGDTVFGRPNPNYALGSEFVVNGACVRSLNDQWHFALARIANACRANGLRPIDGPFTDFGNSVGFRESAARARALGFEGKWAIHPTQIATANDVFSPTIAEVNWAHATIDALTKAKAEGLGAIAMNKVLVDMAHEKLAQKILDRLESISKTERGHCA